MCRMPVMKFPENMREMFSKRVIACRTTKLPNIEKLPKRQVARQDIRSPSDISFSCLLRCLKWIRYRRTTAKETVEWIAVLDLDRNETFPIETHIFHISDVQPTLPYALSL